MFATNPKILGPSGVKLAIAGKIPALYEKIPVLKSRLAKVLEFLDCHQTYVKVLWEIVFCWPF